MAETLLTTVGTFGHSVKSVLNKSAEFASKFMFDGRDDTCYSSDQGLPQYVMINFKRDVIVSSIQLMFQGGFVGQDGVVEIGDNANLLKAINTLELIQDNNCLQKFRINNEDVKCQVLKIAFPVSTDFYGRITMYRLEVFGYECNGV